MKALALTAVSMLLGSALADENAPPPKATPLMTRDLEGIAGKEMLVLLVEYPPGGVSQPHRHDASVFVYVLEGSVTMQVAGSAPVTLKAGETFLRSARRCSRDVGQRQQHGTGEVPGVHGQEQRRAADGAAPQGGRAAGGWLAMDLPGRCCITTATC